MNSRSIISRRDAIGGAFGLGAAALSGLALTSSAQAAFTGSRLLTVGDGGEFMTIDEALDVARSNASPTEPYTVFLLPGIFEWQTPTVLPTYVALVGAHRRSVEVHIEEAAFIEVSDQSSVSDLTIRYRGSGAAIVSGRRAYDFELSRITIHVAGGGTAVEVRWWGAVARFHDLLILTEGVGIALLRGGHVSVYNTQIVLVGTNTQTFHCGYSVDLYTRLWIFGGMFGTGYGYPEISDPGQEVVGILCGAGMYGRVQLHGAWSICRNNVAYVNQTRVNCIRIETTRGNGMVRAFGCYLQAEAPQANDKANAVLTTGPGRFEAHGSRVRDYGLTNSYGGVATGVSRYNTSNDGIQLRTESGGLILLDARLGPFGISLPANWAIEGEQYILKKVDDTANVIEIRASRDWTIEGQSRYIISAPRETLHLRAAFSASPSSGTWWVT